MQAISAATVEELRLKARKLRKDVVTMIYEAGSGHPGGALSVLDILVVLYYKVMNIDPQNDKHPLRDRLVLSKGHACPALYAVLADKGFFPLHICPACVRSVLLQGHPDMHKTPGIDISTGSLGQGFP